VPVEEILILDDCSTDNFKEVVQGFTDPRIKVLAFDENRGMQEAMNQMAFRANGDFFVALSADDTLAPTYVEKCLAKFSENQWLEFVASQTDFIDEKGEPYADQSHPFFSIPKATARPARSGCRRYLPGMSTSAPACTGPRCSRRWAAGRRSTRSSRTTSSI
jgi:glycosyltransferase involved in cell wall biosynthesis